MALQKALFAGDDSTPDAVKRRMMLADLLRKQGADVRNVDSPLEAIGSILQSGGAYLGERRAQEDEAAGLKTRAEGWQKLASSYMSGGAAGASGSMGGADLGGGMDLGGGAIAPSGATANLKPADREDYVMNYYIGKGLAPHQAAGFTGNLIQESSLNTGANNPGDGADGSDSIGIMQANGDRARNLRAFAKGTGRDIGDLDAQLDFTLHEMGIGNPEWRNLPGWGSEGPAGQALKNAQDVQSAAAAGISYERPAGWNRANPTAGHGWDNRFGHAQRLAGMNWSGQQVASASPAPATQQPVQVASLDPSAGMAQTTSAPPTARMIVEQAAARQQAGNPPEMGAQDVAAIQARPKDAQAVPYSGPGATIDPSQAAALAQGGGAPAAPALQANAPVGAPSVQNRQLGALLLAGAQPGPASGVSDAMIAELLGNAWTEDIGQMALQRKIQDNAANARLTRQFQLDQAKTADERQYDRAKTIDQRQYDQMTEAQKRAYDAQVRQEGYAREDSRNNYLDARQGNRDARADLESDRNFNRAVTADQKPPTSVQEYEYARQNGFQGSFSEWETQNRRAGATSISMAGGENKQVFDAVAESAAAAKAAATGLNGLREAKRALNGGIISGAGADTRLGLQKVGAFLGVTDPSAIQNTETFRAAIAPQVAAVMKATVGSANISNSDREFAEKAAGGNINLDEGSILRLVDIMDRAARASIQGHTDRLNRVYPAGGQFERERALFDVGMPEAMPSSDASPAIGTSASYKQKYGLE